MAGTVITQQPASPQDTSSSSALKHDPGVVRGHQPANPGQDDTEAGTLTRGREIGIRNGVRYAYTGNSTTSRAAVPGAMPVASC